MFKSTTDHSLKMILEGDDCILMQTKDNIATCHLNSFQINLNSIEVSLKI